MLREYQMMAGRLERLTGMAFDAICRALRDDAVVDLQGYCGRAIFPLDPARNRLNLSNLSSLGNGCRFSWHMRHFYAVAQHSVLVARIVAELGGTPAERFFGLFHDGHEMYPPGDVASPLLRSPALESLILRAWSTRHRDAFRDALGIPLRDPEVVKRADRVALATERRDLLAPSHPTEGPAWREEPDPHPARIEAWSPGRARWEFWCAVLSLLDAAPIRVRDQLEMAAQNEAALAKVEMEREASVLTDFLKKLNAPRARFT